MGKINVTDKIYENYGNCKVISNGIMEIYVTTDIGPRVIKCNLIGEQNLMFTDIERAAQQDVSDTFGDGKVWYIHGGHRLWVSPEDMPLTYYPDNELVDVKIDGNTVIFTPPAQKINNLQHSWAVTMSENEAKVDIMHYIENTGDSETLGAAWALTVMAKGGIAICPQNYGDEAALLANRVLVLWPYTQMTDERVIWGDKYIVTKQNPQNSRKFKFGYNNTSNWLAYINHGQVFIKTYSSNHPDGNYPDYGVSSEIFTNNLFIEVETLSELQTLKKGEKIVHKESWELRKADMPLFTKDNQGEIEKFVEEFVL
jgi:hypothetical protein